MKLHNHIRNTTHFITSTIGPYANFIPDKESCKIEENYLLPSYPGIRPGDVTLHQQNNVSSKHISSSNRITAIDITIDPNIKTTKLNLSSLDDATQHTKKHHQLHESKNSVDQTRNQQIKINLWRLHYERNELSKHCIIAFHI